MADERIDELFTLDPGDFVAARNSLVRQLRMEGERERAAEVAKLKRPSPAAWAVNQLVRRRRDDVDHLLRLGQELGEAQAGALAGADPRQLREAGRARRDAVAALADAGAALLAERGSGADAHRAGIAATLDTASLDPQAGREMLGGRLTVEFPPPSGFGELDFGLDLVPPAAAAPGAAARAQPAPEPAPRPKRPPGKDLTAAEEAVAEARREAEERTADAEAAFERAADARRRRDEAEAEVVSLERRLDEARRAARTATKEADQAEREAKAAESAAAPARQRLQRAEDRLARLKDDNA